MSIFSGDGRTVLRCSRAKSGLEVFGRPLALRRSMALAIISEYEKKKVWRSPSGGTLWIIQTYLEENARPYRIEVFDRDGPYYALTETTASEEIRG